MENTTKKSRQRQQSSSSAMPVLLPEEFARALAKTYNEREHCGAERPQQERKTSMSPGSGPILF